MPADTAKAVVTETASAATTETAKKVEGAVAAPAAEVKK